VSGSTGYDAHRIAGDGDLVVVSHTQSAAAL